MKKILLLLLIAPVIGFGQVPNGLELTNIIPINLNNYTNQDLSNPQNILTVPNGKCWMILHFHSNTNVNDRYYIKLPVDNSEFEGVDYNNDGITEDWIKIQTLQGIGDVDDITERRYHSMPILIPAGTKLHFGQYLTQSTAYHNNKLIYEFTPTNPDNFSGTLAINEAQFINENKPTLYPNPTSSLLALNSDKEYDIEVYDMAGNKLMAVSGNSINMEHLSTATYIVKATDKSNNEELTYKVVKN